MDARTQRKQYSSLDIIERLLNETTLSTQRVTHGNIIDIGERILKEQTTQETDDNQKEIDEAVEAAKKEAAKELQTALRKQREDLQREKVSSLQNQKEYFEKLTRRISEQRDAAEEERLREERKALGEEKERALRRLQLESEEAKKRAIVQACQELRQKMVDECADERNRAVQKAVELERKEAKERELAAVDRTCKECQRKYEEEKNKLRSLHKQDLKEIASAYSTLQKSYSHLFDHCRSMERDFKALQEDYRRFMDYTDGKFHSDYLMDLRRHGMVLANQDVPIYKLPDDGSTS